MADTSQLSAEPRAGTGRGAARAARRQGRVPAGVYGGGGLSQAISLNTREFGVALGRQGFFATLFELDVGGEKQRVLCREVQFHPVKDNPMHADFLRVSATTRINVDVPVRFINEEECPGLKEGGVLNVVRHVIELSCRADSIPPVILIDLTGREMGTSIHISEVSLPDGVQPTIGDRDFTIATVAAPTVQAVEEEEAAEGEGLEDGEALAEGEEAAEGETPADGDKPAEGEGAKADDKKSKKS